MAKNKQIRSMSAVGASQHLVEKETAEKFDSIQELAQATPVYQPREIVKKASKVEKVELAGRISPQLSCTISPEDKEMLNELALYACNREKKLMNTSTIVRALIRLGDKYKDKLIF